MAPIVEEEDDESSRGWWKHVEQHLNFYRIHVLYYVTTPLIFSAIFYASNGRYHIPYIDCLFTCVSAMTVCGLTTINLSALTGWQQVILVIQMLMGSPITIAWVVVYQRRYFFAQKFQHVLEEQARKRAEEDGQGPSRRLTTWPSRLSTILRGNRDLRDVGSSGDMEYVPEKKKKKKKGLIQKLRPDMIRRVDAAPRLVNPSGFAIPLRKEPTIHNSPNGHLHFSEDISGHDHNTHLHPDDALDQEDVKRYRRLSDPGVKSRPGSPVSPKFPKSDTLGDSPKENDFIPQVQKSFPRTQTIEFAPTVTRQRLRPSKAGDDIIEESRPQPEPLQHHHDRRSMHSRRASLQRQVSRQPSISTHRTWQTPPQAKHSGFGFFPILDTLGSLVTRIFPKFQRKIKRTLTIPATMSLVSRQSASHSGHHAKMVPYISFDAIVGRNSKFHQLTREEMEELGGVEYRALNALLWIVGGYHILIQLLAFVVIAPYMSMARWRSNFEPPETYKPINTVWYSAFQAISAYTNTGMSLSDKSILPFQRAYPMVTLVGLLILAGNTAFPIFLRFIIWVLSKCVPSNSRAHETLHFLLDHPRRCFILLFPSHQTWFLLSLVVFLNVVDWVCFLILDIGNAEIDAIPVGVRVFIGLFQAISVRAAGYSAVSMAGVASGVKVLYVIMMYISVYPIAMSIRSTNVYEEQSLGIFPDEPDEDDEDFQPSGGRMHVWGRYVALHARKQLSFDMWWIGFALFILCIDERKNLDDPSSAIWFNIFSMIFDLVSAYGTVGLSLGVPYDNFAFSGSLKPFSKFVLCVVMIRGRHRILPVAIDRAVMLPSEFQRALDLDDHLAAPRSTTLITDDTKNAGGDQQIEAEKYKNGDSEAN